ncbi:MAG: PepSY-associated TM helix domain-containing protein [Acidobacteriota bacterium]
MPPMKSTPTDRLAGPPASRTATPQPPEAGTAQRTADGPPAPTLPRGRPIVAGNPPGAAAADPRRARRKAARQRWTRVRNAMLVWHRWFGLLAGVWLFLLASTGTVLVFYEEIDHFLNPSLFHRPAVGERLPFEDLVRIAEASHAGSYASYVDLPNAAHEPVVAFLRARADAEQPVTPGLHTFVDPYTGEVLASRVAGAFKLDRLHIARWIYELHMNLHLDTFGAVLLAIVALLWIFDHIPSVWLSFPRLRGWWRSFMVKRSAKGAALAYGWHRASGLWLAPVTLVLAVSGLYFNLYPVFVAAVEAVSPLTKRTHQTAPQLEEPVYGPEVPVDRALAVASFAAGGAEVDSLSVLPASGLYWVRLFDPRDLADYGQRSVYVDMGSGEVVGDSHRAVGSAGDVFVALQFPLHSGKILGWPGRILIALTGLVICALVITGFVLWLRRARGRRGAAAG